jgi:cyclase
MLRKRLLGAVVVRQGWAVQSFGYRRWLPLGKPECLVENLDLWGADGIVVLAIDRGDQGPDLPLIERLGALGLSTPLTYGGGLRNEADARAAVRAGAERLVLDAVLQENPAGAEAMAQAVGVQALVAALPLVRDGSGAVLHWLHRRRKAVPISLAISELVAHEAVSELLVIDVAGEGAGRGFDAELLAAVEPLGALPLLAFGGLATAEQLRPLLSRPRLAGVLVGNALNYREHAIGRLKAALTDQPLRPHHPRTAA